MLWVCLVFKSPSNAIWPYLSKKRWVCWGSTTTLLPVQCPSCGQRVAAYDVAVCIDEVKGDCVLPAASIGEPGKRAHQCTAKFGSSAWFCTPFRELSFTTACNPWKQLCLKGDTAVPSTGPRSWRGCPHVPQSCCNGKLCPSWRVQSLIFAYTSLVTALANASTRPAGIIGFFPSNLAKAFRQPLHTFSIVCLVLYFCLNYTIPKVIRSQGRDPAWRRYRWVRWQVQTHL